MLKAVSVERSGVESPLPTEYRHRCKSDSYDLGSFHDICICPVVHILYIRTISWCEISFESEHSQKGTTTHEYETQIRSRNQGFSANVVFLNLKTNTFESLLHQDLLNHTFQSN